MVYSRRSCSRLCLGLLALLFLGIQAAPRTGWAQADEGDAVDPAALQHWVDFCHYVRIANPSLAHGAGEALLSSVDDEQLVDVVEAAAGDYPNWERILIRAGKVETLVDTAVQLSQRIQAGRILRARDPDRIQRDIQALAAGLRANMNATERLRAAGEHAVPALLATLLDDTQKRLHTHVLQALVAMGRPVVYPLSVALVGLEPVPQAQIARVLANIGYPRAAPYLKHAIEDERTDPDARIVLVAAFDRLLEQLPASARVPANVSAAELHETLGRNYYNAETARLALPGQADDESESYVWYYSRVTGLVATAVPSRIFGSALARIEARHALRLEPGRSPALSLWLMSALRGENNLGPDEQDASYGHDLLEPMFYLIAAGPQRQHDVLKQGLDDADSALALDAIDALRATAGTDALVNREGAAQPLLRAMSYPDRRVRFEAVLALANTHPDASFPGSDGIVHVLAEAVRQSDTRYAVVLGADQDSTNAVMAALDDLDYEPIGGLSVADLTDAIAGKPGVDVIVTNQSPEHVRRFVHQRVGDYKLSSVPLIVLATPGNMATMNQAFEGQRGIYVIAGAQQAADLEPAVAQAAADHGGAPISVDEGYDYAMSALEMLAQIALGSSEVFNVTDALPALIEALGDDRPEVVSLAADVLALIDTIEGQQAIAEAAQGQTRAADLRIALLGSLSASATHMGNQLNEPQLDKVLELAKTSTGEMAIAAARAHGALMLPTSNVVEMLTGE